MPAAEKDTGGRKTGPGAASCAAVTIRSVTFACFPGPVLPTEALYTLPTAPRHRRKLSEGKDREAMTK